MIEILIAGLGTGSMYALIAVGFNVLFKSTDSLNFAQGEWAMAGGMVAALLNQQGLSSVWIACGLSVIAVALAGAVTERLAVRPIRHRTATKITLVSVGVALVSKSIVMLSIGKDPQGYPGFSSIETIQVFGVTVATQVLWIFAITCALMIATHLFFEKTKYGIAMRASAADPRAAALMGIDNTRVVAASFVIAALFGAVAGVLITPLTLMTYDAGAMLGFKGFAAAMLGGLGNLYGAVVGGVLLGVIEALTAGYLSAQFKDALSFLLLMTVLVARPQGLFGRAQVTKV